MFKIIKTKGKTFVTDNPEKAIQAYTHKWSVSLWYNGNVVLTKCSKNMVLSQVHVWAYIDQYCNLRGR